MQTFPVNMAVDAELDITSDRCPMTYVRVRLALDRMDLGQVLRVSLQGEEPLRNVPQTATLQGHQVLSVEPGPVSVLLIRKGGARGG